MPWVEPIFDRTIMDVATAQNNRESTLPQKGARNYTDLVRITGNIYYIRDLMNQHGISPAALTSKLNWVLGEVPTYNDILQIKNDLNKLKTAFSALQISAPPTPDLPYLSYYKLNDVEEILFIANRILKGIEEMFIYSGEIYGGELWQ